MQGVSYIPVETLAADTTIKSGVEGYFIRLLGLVLWSEGAVVLTFKSGSHKITGGMELQDGDGQVWPATEIGYCQCHVGDSLVMSLDTGVAINGTIIVRLLEKSWH